MICNVKHFPGITMTCHNVHVTWYWCLLPQPIATVHRTRVRFEYTCAAAFELYILVLCDVLTVLSSIAI